MLDSIFATKRGMTQAWSKQGKRLAVTRCLVEANLVVDQKNDHIFEIGYGCKKLKNMSQPLRSKMQQSGFSFGAKQLKGVRFNSLKLEATDNTPPRRGDVIKAEQVLSVGDVVQVQGTTKGRGFTGVMKRYGFKGGSRTHGQSDRERAPGSIGAGTDPGRVWPGKKMPGRHGGIATTVRGLTVLYINPENGEVWLSGPVPGHFASIVKITRTGENRPIELDYQASGIEKTEDEVKVNQDEKS